jgi:hypothetical protein
MGMCTNITDLRRQENFCTPLDVSGRVSSEICVGNGWGGGGRITVIKVGTPGRCYWF